MDNTLELASKPKYGLLMFPKNASDIAALNGTINRMQHEVRFPNGNKLLLGFGEGEDILKYLGCRFDFVRGTQDERLLSLVK